MTKSYFLMKLELDICAINQQKIMNKNLTMFNLINN